MKTGGKVNYYLVKVEHPRRPEQSPYQAECDDIAMALGMTPAEFCEFKAIWRTAAARLGNGKPGGDAVYDAEKRVHYATLSLDWEKQRLGAWLVATPPVDRTPSMPGAYHEQVAAVNSVEWVWDQYRQVWEKRPPKTPPTVGPNDGALRPARATTPKWRKWVAGDPYPNGDVFVRLSEGGDSFRIREGGVWPSGSPLWWTPDGDEE